MARFVRRERINDADLKEAIERAERGIIDADLGHGVIKQRVARTGQGRSGGFRMIVAYRTQGAGRFSSTALPRTTAATLRTKNCKP